MTMDLAIQNQIITQLVLLAEMEPYGISGGTIVVLFKPPPTTTITCPVKIGRFPLDPTLVSTYELHLTLESSKKIEFNLANLISRLQGKKAKLVVDKFSLVKKKLYRS